MSSTRPAVSIITINYNQLQHTLDLLASLEHVTYPNVEVIVVDNCSVQDPTAEIKRLYPKVTVLRSETNLGFAGGNNLGIRSSKGDYLLFLNNDTEVDPGFLEPLVEMFEQHPNAGAASSKLIYYNSGNTIQYAGSTMLNPFTGRNKVIGWMEKDNGQYDTLRETALAHGCSMMVPRKVIEQVGLMPELFFLYYEEIDWCQSIKRAGFKIYFVPQSKVFHKESMSVGKKSTLKTYYMTRNRLLYMRRNSAGLHKTLALLFFMFFSFPKNLITYLKQRETDHIKAFWRGCVWNLTHLSNGNKLFA
ncbi:glycosyltransferase family 2 protein [Chryseosolibacter indicus]|uniref:Glycosyltransferase family 2 protein n=1 Tax=Chryseosolibacter indicus TaxID=2782351 RepID=A0ABS5VMA8_9BACT|nr:glycosyltransferase family 2 protein [Chryseosolibacter indicus]MBT1702579.1 glycosyltransferase family 2 protein [Chryseosolibacter indicus]